MSPGMTIANPTNTSLLEPEHGHHRSAVSACSAAMMEVNEKFLREQEQQQQQQEASRMQRPSMGMSRTKSVFAMPLTEAMSLSSLSGSSSESLSEDSPPSAATHRQLASFGAAMRHQLRKRHCSDDEEPDQEDENDNHYQQQQQQQQAIHFDSGMRKVMEPYLRQARSLRELARSRTEIKVDASIAGSVGVPYTCLRQERPFLFDEHSYPLHSILARALSVPDLAYIHQYGDNDYQVLQPLLNTENRQVFQYAYDNFVTSFCLPLLHSVAIAKDLFHWAGANSGAEATDAPTRCDSITYRYQAFPTIHIARPGCPAQPPRCATSLGHSIGCLFFHIPLTPSQGDAAVFCESHPGKEDWHPLQTKSVGMGYMYDGARCLQFGLDNTSATSRVSLEFCVLLYREERTSSPRSFRPVVNSNTLSEDFYDLCTPEMLQDRFAAAGPGYYEEAVIDLGRQPAGLLDAVRRKSRKLVTPDGRFGVPFC
eukprot:CAMPEP_0172444064 /NCGR_PEP_ID=MMETSP1065-20121228/4187_1 /TAXON_ID=265537 /ORGANISM="Amphiprora paludosa, Strain CCMP125" /LENGTH=481 /DNA_ID=CAMNT_0013194483 /DNA_START=124 /DNA_END=1569 /DNA_ORIENTATION=+